jgi:hypothetical protein
MRKRDRSEGGWVEAAFDGYTNNFVPRVRREDTTHEQGEDDQRACITTRFCAAYKRR